jgi:hypothetical protein
MNWENMNFYRLFKGKQGGKRPLGRPRYTRVDNIKLDLGEIRMVSFVRSGLDWSGQDRDKCGIEPSASIKC